MKYELIKYDVWGNPRDGFEVNNKFSTGTYVEIPDDIDDADIVRILKDEGIIKKSARFKSIEIEGEFRNTLYFTYVPTGRPEFELQAHESKPRRIHRWPGSLA